MLKLINIYKEYASDSDRVVALKGINLSFRRHEFVSILGPSGCGKTTLLNLIGGLDQYSAGDLVIAGKSTRDFRDRDWDAYRNHSVGFVFQSYNLIPHQSVLSNVELALTLSGMSKAKRRKKALAALEKVGLKDQVKKRPNQLSGGQMQRVAIARALAGDPEIVLADEPTGALDSATSIQIMDLLKEIAKDKLVIMVTHNPALANDYSTRIIQLLDGQVQSDSNPYTDTETIAPKEKKEKKPSMSRRTALSLSLNNLMTKKGRAILTSFAGSIGIIGIALILSLSNGINAYIESVQEKTLATTPLTLQAESVDLSGLMTTLMRMRRGDDKSAHARDAVYSSNVMNDLIRSLNSAKVQKNNLALFKEYLEKDETIRSYLSHIHYSYDLGFHILTQTDDGKIAVSNLEKIMEEVLEGMGTTQGMVNQNNASFGNVSLWQEMLPEPDQTGINHILKDQYEVLSGDFPASFDEVVLIVDQNNELSDLALCALGVKSTGDVIEAMKNAQNAEEDDEETAPEAFSYESLCGREFKIFLPSELYQKNPSGTYTLLTETEKGEDFLYASDRGQVVKICGILRLKDDETTGMMTGAIGYTSELTRVMLDKVAQSPLIAEQKSNPDKDVLKDLPFLPEDFTEPADEEKIRLITDYLMQCDNAEQARIFREISATPAEEYVTQTVEQTLAGQSRAELEKNVLAALAQNEKEGTDLSYIEEYTKTMSDEELFDAVRQSLAAQITEAYRNNVLQSLAGVPDEVLSARLLLSLQNKTYSDAMLLLFYETYMPPAYSDGTLENNLKLLGDIHPDAPSSIELYSDRFEDKDALKDCISQYNQGKEEADRIEYTDVFGMILSGVTTIINAISYVLIAFVSISLIVSSIMIGIITYISVLERTKEIGILRAVGASKKDVSRVFNAESVIEGFFAGVFGILITLLLILPINAIIRALSDIPTLGARLPAGAGIILVLISVLLSFIAGLFPSRLAAKKNPVEALRTE